MSRKVSYSELPAYLKRMVDRTRAVHSKGEAKTGKAPLRRSPEQNRAEQQR